MTTYRIAYKGIISELYVPETYNGRAVVFLPGLPMSLSLGKSALLQALVNEGCAVFHPFYSGSYDSEGDFSYEHCIQDVEKFIEMAKHNGHNELYYGVRLELPTKKIIVIGSSFGGTIGIQNKCLDKIDALVLLSPVLEYNQRNLSDIDSTFDFKAQMDALFHLLKEAYSYTYRLENQEKFLAFLHGEGKYGFDTTVSLNKIPVKTLLVHGQNDVSIPVIVSQHYQSLVTNENITWVYPPECGHNFSAYDTQTIERIVNFVVHD